MIRQVAGTKHLETWYTMKKNGFEPCVPAKKKHIKFYGDLNFEKKWVPDPDRCVPDPDLEVRSRSLCARSDLGSRLHTRPLVCENKVLGSQYGNHICHLLLVITTRDAWATYTAQNRPSRRDARPCIHTFPLSVSHCQLHDIELRCIVSIQMKPQSPT